MAAFAVTALWLAVYPDIDHRTIIGRRRHRRVDLPSRQPCDGSARPRSGRALEPILRCRHLGSLLRDRRSSPPTQGKHRPDHRLFGVACNLHGGVAVALPGSRRDLTHLFGGRATRVGLLLARQTRILVGLRHIYINQIIDLARTYLDRMVLPLMAGFHLAGIYNVFALAASVAVMVPNALCGQVDLPRLVETAREDRAAYLPTVTAGIVRAAGIAGLMIAPLFLMKPAVDTILTLSLDPGLYYVLCGGSMVSAMLAAVADYYWYAIYAARAERGLSRYAIPTIVLSVVLLVGGIATFGSSAPFSPSLPSTLSWSLFTRAGAGTPSRKSQGRPRAVQGAGGPDAFARGQRVLTCNRRPIYRGSRARLGCFRLSTPKPPSRMRPSPCFRPCPVRAPDRRRRQQVPVAEALARDPRYATLRRQDPYPAQGAERRPDPGAQRWADMDPGARLSITSSAWTATTSQ